MNMKKLQSNTRVVVAVVGPKGSGKTTLCRNFEKKLGGKMVSFATELKEICSRAFELPLEDMYANKETPLFRPVPMTPKLYKRVLLSMQNKLESMGIKDMDWRRTAINLFAPPALFHTPRQILQWVGTEFMQTVYPAYHCLVLGSQMKENGFYFVDDCRFAEEHTYLKESFKNFYVIKIRGRNEVKKGEEEHASEAGWLEMPCDIEITNKSTIANFNIAGIEAFEKYLETITEDDIKIGVNVDNFDVTDTLSDFGSIKTLTDPTTNQTINVEEEVKSGRLKKVGNFIFRHDKRLEK